MIDQSKKRSLIDAIKVTERSGKPEILLTPEEYFDGYEADHCSICANNSAGISTARFLEKIRTVEARPDVTGVFVRFYDYADAEEFEGSWIGSDSIYLVTSAGLKEVESWFLDFEVSDVWEDADIAKFAGLPPMPEAFQLIAVWWD